MINFDDVIKENTKENNSKWPEMSDQLYRTLTEEGSGSRETNALLNLINHETDIDKIVLYVKDSHEVKYQFLTNQQKIQAWSILMILKLLLNAQIIWIIFTEKLMNTIQRKNVRDQLFLMMWLLICLVIKYVTQ